jgi:AcrR family transcriptional regulator
VPRLTRDGKVRRTQEERSAETRTRLLDATVDCLIDLGYADTTTTVIAERAGVSRGAQLHHFPTKAELVAAAVEHLTRRIGEELHHEVSRLPGDGDRVSAAVDLLWSRFATPLFPAWLELLVAARTDRDLRKRLQVVEEGLARASHRQIEEIFGEARNAPGYALAINLTLNLMYGMALQRALAPTEGRGLKRKEVAMVSAWKGVFPRLLDRA